MDEFDDIVLDDYGFDAEPLPTPPPPPPADTNPAELTPTPDQAKKVQKIKFNESLLLETKGIPLLRNESRYIRFQGKGHEADDLKRLITYYTVWANNLYPKFRFKDFARRVQKPASTDRVKKVVEVWQNEYKERLQARREVLQELSGETVGDVDGENPREEEESSDDDNRPLFFPISEQAAEAMKKNKSANKRKTKTTTTKPNSKHRSKDTINSSEDEDSDDEPTTQPRTVTFSDSEDETSVKKKPEPSPVNGRAHALAILAEKRKQKLQAQKGAAPQKERNDEEEEEEEEKKTRGRFKSSARIMDSDSEEDNYDEQLSKILNHNNTSKPTEAVELAKSDDEIEEDIPAEDDTGLLDDVVMEAVEDVVMEEV